MLPLKRRWIDPSLAGWWLLAILATHRDDATVVLTKIQEQTQNQELKDRIARALTP